MFLDLIVFIELRFGVYYDVLELELLNDVMA